MATVDKKIADDIIAGKYNEDCAMYIVKYTNAWGGESYGVCFEGDDPNKYLIPSSYIRNPQFYWKRGAK